MKDIILSRRFLFGLMVILCICNGILVYIHYDRIIYYDSAPEMQLAKLLFAERCFISKNWFYSTEIRAFYLQWVFTPLFLFTDNWRIIRTIGTVIWNLLMTFSLKYALDAFSSGKRNYVIAMLVEMPLSWIWYWYTVINLYYIPIVFIIFICLGGFIRYLKYRKKRYLMISAVVAVLGGLNGIRGTLTLFVPLFLATVVLQLWRMINDADIVREGYKQFGFTKIENNFSTIAPASFLLLLNVTGYLINSKIFSQAYYFKSYENCKLIGLNFEQIQQTLNGLLCIFGYGEGGSVRLFSIYGISWLFAAFLLAITIYVYIFIYNKLKDIDTAKRTGNTATQVNYGKLIILTCSSIAFFIHFFVQFFSNAPIEPRYYIPIFAMAFLVWGIYLSVDKNIVRKVILLLCVTISIALCSAVTGRVFIKWDAVGKQLRDVVAYLNQKNYSAGYSEFYVGACLPELTSKHVPMYYTADWQSLKSQNWLEVNGVEKLDGKVFLLLSNSQYKKNLEKSIALQGGTIAFQNKAYTVLEYENNFVLWETVKKKVMSNRITK